MRRLAWQSGQCPHFGLVLIVAFAVFVALHNSCGQTRMLCLSGKNRPTPAMAAGVTDTLWSFDKLLA